MTNIQSSQDVRQLGTILSVWAHPDDESYSCAGIMAAAMVNGQEIACVTATKGEAGVQDESRWPAARLGDIRAAEMREVLKTLGITKHHWLGYADGGCKDVAEQLAVRQIRSFIDQYQPDSILTFGPDGMTGHDDHRTVSRWVSLAAAGTAAHVYHAVQLPDIYASLRQADEQFNIFFNIDKPPLREPEQCAILLRLQDDLLIQKYRCLCAMPSQTEAMFREFGQETICTMICTEAFVRAEATV